MYTVLPKRTTNKTFMLEVLLEALELLKLFKPLEALELKTYNVF